MEIIFHAGDGRMSYVKRVLLFVLARQYHVYRHKVVVYVSGRYEEISACLDLGVSLTRLIEFGWFRRVGGEFTSLPNVR